MLYHLENLKKESKKHHGAFSSAPLFSPKGKYRINLVGLGDVGGTLLTGLKLLGSDVISQIGIYSPGDITIRYEYEMNQIGYPDSQNSLPEVIVFEKEDLFDCDLFVFCASRSVPALDSGIEDVRMAQFTANREIIREYARLARIKGFRGIFAVVSDPVDPLCKVAYIESNTDEAGLFDNRGMHPSQIQGYGLGVMNSRAAYYAKRETKFHTFLTDGRAFGPHGKDLVIANSIENYDDELSKELTRLTVEANLRVREIGFKPYIAPALSSGAISLLLTLRGEWHYSSICWGDVFLGCRNRMTEVGPVPELLPLPELLYQRILFAYQELEKIV
ncbi:lactate dehydrogenase [Anoxybacterium hadale]|uniref:Lactate dehydrogenase n=1 Tax=Anoxybacterium hadale TaxID=3408580 RepID=A0ACD1AA24_9FIRM|nr:lactate dehydrogenase [Clostridiales bacterium]